MVTATSPGAYALGFVNAANAFVVKYVGRSDVDLNARLTQHASAGKYAKFKCGYLGSPKAAFDHECRMFHDFGGSNSLDNKVHPARPANSGWRCVACNIFG